MKKRKVMLPSILNNSGNIDPYPGFIQIIGWKEEGLIISSDVALNQLDKIRRRVENAESNFVEKHFIWYVVTDTIIQK